MSDSRVFFRLHGEPVIIFDSEDEDAFLRLLEIDIEAVYDSEGEDHLIEDIGEGLDPNEDPFDDLSEEEDSDEDPIEEGEHIVVEPEIEEVGKDPIVEDEHEFIDWDDVLLYIDDGPSEGWDDEDQADGPNEEEGQLEDPVVEDVDDMMMEDQEGVGLEDFENPIWDFPTEGEHKRGSGSPR